MSNVIVEMGQEMEFLEMPDRLRLLADHGSPEYAFGTVIEINEEKETITLESADGEFIVFPLDDTWSDTSEYRVADPFTD